MAVLEESRPLGALSGIDLPAGGAAGRQQLHLVKAGIFSQPCEAAWAVPALGDDQIWLG